ncbi:glucokinase [Lysobacter sp. D1-1-M9]|uniref:glucokinase n=2 Tax=Novilysobacter TaxID=3382699 RepID=UPI002FCBD0D0
MSGVGVLLADIGGTNARFALAHPGDSPPLLADSIETFQVEAFASLADAARHYLDGRDAQVRDAVFAVAGRVDGDEARITNHPWVISIERTRRALDLEHLQMVNDFAAQAMAVSLLDHTDVAQVGSARWPGHDVGVGDDGRDRTYAVIGPGTGLGVGALLRRNGQYHALQTEGGHVSFAPGTPEEIGVLQRLSGEFGRVSNERLVSGGGLVNLHRALSAMAGGEEAHGSPGPLRPEDITARAIDGDARCLHTIDVFCAVFGAAAGDLVLTLGAWDGVFLTGGVVPRVMPWLAHSGFRHRFEHKGRFSPAMATVPTLAVTHPHPGLLGAAALARQLPQAPAQALPGYTQA